MIWKSLCKAWISAPWMSGSTCLTCKATWVRMFSFCFHFCKSQNQPSFSILESALVSYIFLTISPFHLFLFFKKRKVLPFNSWERRTEPNGSLPFHPLTARSLTCLRLVMLLYTRVTVTRIQNYHSTPTHRASQSCSFPSKFPLHLISEEEASNDASSAP